MPQPGAQPARTTVRGFAQPALDSQRAFRCVLAALAEPAKPVAFAIELPDYELRSATAAIVLSLADEDTAWWFSSTVSTSSIDALRFHTGLTVTDRADCADFALVRHPSELPNLSSFRVSEAMCPERSTTLVVEVDDFDTGVRATLGGPGFDAPRSLAPAGFEESHWDDLALNHLRAPAGVDLILTSESALVGLPRSTRVMQRSLRETPECRERSC